MLTCLMHGSLCSILFKSQLVLMSCISIYICNLERVGNFSVKCDDIE